MSAPTLAPTPHADLELEAAVARAAAQLLVAIQDGALGDAEELLARGADPNMASPHDGMTPLLLASMDGHLGIVRRLLDLSADPDTALTRPPQYCHDDGNEDNTTPLIEACREGHFEVARLLLERWAEPDEQSGPLHHEWNGDWPLTVTCDVSIAQLLAVYGADPWFIAGWDNSGNSYSFMRMVTDNGNWDVAGWLDAVGACSKDATGAYEDYSYASSNAGPIWRVLQRTMHCHRFSFGSALLP